MQELNVFYVAGEPYEIGQRLGALARPIFADYMRQSEAWHALSRWRGSPFVQRLRRAAEVHFPEQIAELDGMAAALNWTAQDLFLWNCRGELIHHAPDGCTTLAAAIGGARLIAHNEDGDPFLRGRCSVVNVLPDGKPGFVSFYYPGSLPGHTFAVNRAGLVQTINNLRVRDPEVGVPRMIAARALLDTRSLDEAVRTLQHAPLASGFHHTLGCAGDARLLSVEATAQRCSVQTVDGMAGHANHMIHPDCSAQAQIVTDSSRERQMRLAELLPILERSSGDVAETAAALLGALGDRTPRGLPIYRDDPHDPDGENTLATVLFRIENDSVAMDVYQQGRLVLDTVICSTARASSSASSIASS